jgi:hypothetical protein
VGSRRKTSKAGGVPVVTPQSAGERENAVKDVFYTACAVIKEHARMDVDKKMSADIKRKEC